jgi:hypothetical protein
MPLIIAPYWPRGKIMPQRFLFFNEQASVLRIPDLTANNDLLSADAPQIGTT